MILRNSCFIKKIADNGIARGNYVNIVIFCAGSYDPMLFDN